MDKKTKYQDQIDAISKQIVKEPANAELYLKRAELYAKDNNYENAKVDRLRSLEIDPEIEEYFLQPISDELIQKVQNYLDDGNFSKVIETLNNLSKYEKLDKYNKLEINMLLNVLKNISTDLIPAIYNYDRSIEIPEEELESCLISSYNMLIGKFYKNPNLYLHRGIYFLAKNEINKSINDLSKYIELERNNNFGYFLRGICNGMLRDDNKMIMDFNKSVSLNENVNNEEISKNITNISKKFNTFPLIRYSLNYSNFLNFIGERYNLVIMLKSFEKFFDINLSEEIKIGFYLDRLDLKKSDIFRNKKIAEEIFYSYPNYENSLDYLLKRDGKEIFLLNIKMSFLKKIAIRYINSDIGWCFDSLEYVENGYLGLFNQDEINQQYNIINTIINLTGNIQQQLIEIECEIARIQKESKEKLEKMIQQYSHTLANTLYPNSIYEVANKLKRHIEFRKDAMILNDAYHAEVLITRQGQMLQVRNTGSDKSFQMLIRGDRLDKNSKEKIITIEGIMNNSLERILAGRFLNENYYKLDSIRDILSKKTKMNLKKWNNSFEENVFFNSRQTAIEWASKNIAKINYQLSPKWSEIRLAKDKYAEALLQGYFSELFFNALKYRDQNQETWVNINFNEKQISKKTYLVSTWENPFLSKEKLTLGSGLGLEGIKNDLEMLNDTDDEKMTLRIEKDDKIFKVILNFSKDLFIPNIPIEIDQKKLSEALKGY